VAGGLEEANARGQHPLLVAGEVVGLQEQNTRARRLVADAAACSPLAFASSKPASDPGGRTTTQRLPPPMSVSSTRSKPTLRT
jgi:hypothetical protein